MTGFYRRMRINAEVSTQRFPDEIEERIREALAEISTDVHLVAFYNVS